MPYIECQKAGLRIRLFHFDTESLAALESYNGFINLSLDLDALVAKYFPSSHIRSKPSKLYSF